jgi:hypothetical protein
MRDKPTGKQMDSLPKWASRYIELLEMRLKESRELAGANWGSDPSGFCIERLSHSGDGRTLCEYLPITTGDCVIVGTIEVSGRRGKCVVMGRGAYPIQVHPNSSNMVTIACENTRKKGGE